MSDNKQSRLAALEDENKQLKERLSQLEKGYDKIFTQENMVFAVIKESPYATWITNADGQVVFVNQACRTLLGIEDDEGLSDYNVQDDSILKQSGVLDEVEKVYSRGEAAHTTVSWNTNHFRKEKQEKSGKVLYLELSITPVRDSHGRLMNVVFFFTDVSNVVKIEKLFQEAEMKYYRLIQDVNSVILRFDLDGKVTFLNEYAEMILGYNSEEMIGQKLPRTLLPKNIERGKTSREFVARVIQNPKRYKYTENECICKDGRILWIAWSTKVTQNQDGSVKEVVCVGNDITKAHRAELKRIQLLEQYKKALEEIENLRGIIPICANCRKIRDDKGYWSKLEQYLSEHLEAEFSHSLCPECAGEYFSTLDTYLKNPGNNETDT